MMNDRGEARRKKPEKWKSGFKQEESPKAPVSVPAPNSEHCLTQVIKQKLPAPTEKIAVFIFRRDLRIFDNTSLIAAAADGFKILPVFIFPPEQIDEKENEYFSHPCVQFMCLSLSQVHKELVKIGSKLNFIKLANADALTQLKKEVNFDAVYSNEDYSFYAVSRDQEVRSWCRENRVKFVQKEDYGMMKLDENLDKHKRPIRTHAAFMRGFRANCTVRRPTEVAWTPDNFVSFDLNCEIPEQQIHTFYENNPKLAVTPGRSGGMANLKSFEKLVDYRAQHNMLDQETSRSSPHTKFGTVSVRETYWRGMDLFGEDFHVIRQLGWREMYLKVYAARPEWQKGQSIHKILDEHVDWSYDEEVFQKWCQGETGFPIVDAGMRELNETGFQHNRARMNCASVLTKILLIDWRWGYKFFYRKLVDSDIFNNTAGWGVLSSTGLGQGSAGPDNPPYINPFNPFMQSQKFDPHCEYIKKWVPELANVQNRDIHKWHEQAARRKYTNCKYPAPIVNYSQAAQRCHDIFNKAASIAKSVK